jgi:hypothetical protein
MNSGAWIIREANGTCWMAKVILLEFCHGKKTEFLNFNTEDGIAFCKT